MKKTYVFDVESPAVIFALRKTLCLSIIVLVLMISAPLSAFADVFSNNTPYNASDFPVEKHQSTTALRQPYWSATPVNVSPDYKQIHVILTHVDHGIGKTKVNLSLSPGGNYSLTKELAKHVVDVSKHIRPSQLNAHIRCRLFHNSSIID